MPNLTFDPTGSRLTNYIPAEVHTPIVSPAIFPVQTPFYDNGVVIHGTVGSDPTEILLVFGTDYTYSPKFNIIKNILGLDAYTFILLTDYTHWSSLTIRYHAVGGYVDEILLSEIGGAGAFDRTNRAIWDSFVGDAIVLSRLKIDDLLSQTANVYVLSRQLEIIAAAVASPITWLEQIQGDYNDHISMISTMGATVESMATALRQIGVYDGMVTQAIPGEIRKFAGTVPPTGWVECSDVETLVPVSQNAALFARIGYAFGGSGPSFSVPWIVGIRTPHVLTCYKT